MGPNEWLLAGCGVAGALLLLTALLPLLAYRVAKWWTIGVLDGLHHGRGAAGCPCMREKRNGQKGTREA